MCPKQRIHRCTVTNFVGTLLFYPAELPRYVGKSRTTDRLFAEIALQTPNSNNPHQFLRTPQGRCKLNALRFWALVFLILSQILTQTLCTLRS